MVFLSAWFAGDLTNLIGMLLRPSVVCGYVGVVCVCVCVSVCVRAWFVCVVRWVGCGKRTDGSTPACMQHVIVISDT